MTQPTKPATDSCHCFALRRAARRISNHYDAMLAPSGLRISQFSLLALIRQYGAPTINTLAELMDLDRTTTGKNLRPLEREGLVRIVRPESDRRARAAELTEAGKTRLAEAGALWRQAQVSYEALNGAGPIAEVEAQLAGFSMP